MNRTYEYPTKISDLPGSVIRKICQLLIFSFQAENEGFRSVLAFRSVSYHFFRTINSCSLNITYDISTLKYYLSKEHCFPFSYNSNRAEYFLTHLVESTDWKFNQFSILLSIVRTDMTYFDEFFSDQKKLICSRYRELFGNNLKTVVLDLHNSDVSNDGNNHFALTLADEIFPEIGNKATEIDMNLRIWRTFELPSFNSRFFHHVKKLTIQQTQLSFRDNNIAYQLAQLCFNVEELTLIKMDTLGQTDGFEVKFLEKMPKVTSFKCNKLNSLTLINGPILDRITTLQLDDWGNNPDVQRWCLSNKCPNLVNLTLRRPLETKKPKKTAHPFKIPPKLKTLKANASFLSRTVCDLVSKLEELYIIYDECDLKSLKRLIKSRDLSSLRIVNITVSRSLQPYSPRKIWKLACYILKARPALKVLSVRSLTSNCHGDPDYQPLCPIKFAKIASQKVFFWIRSAQTFSTTLLYFNFFETIVKNTLDQATIRRLDELDLKYEWNLRSGPCSSHY